MWGLQNLNIMKKLEAFGGNMAYLFGFGEILSVSSFSFCANFDLTTLQLFFQSFSFQLSLQCRFSIGNN